MIYYMFKYKYLKYKQKYLNLKGGGVLRIINTYSREILNNVPDDDIINIQSKSSSIIYPYKITKQGDKYKISKNGREYGDNYSFELKKETTESLAAAQYHSMPQLCQIKDTDTDTDTDIDYNIQRFIDVQNSGSYNGQYYGSTYEKAMEELRDGHKKTHWVWYCLPNIDIDGVRETNGTIIWLSPTAKLFSIKTFAEAIVYVKNPILKTRLLYMFSIIYDKLINENVDVNFLMGSFIDVIKLRSCVTLFFYAFQCVSLLNEETSEIIIDLKDRLGEDEITYRIITTK